MSNEIKNVLSKLKQSNRKFVRGYQNMMWFKPIIKDSGLPQLKICLTIFQNETKTIEREAKSFKLLQFEFQVANV